MPDSTLSDHFSREKFPVAFYCSSTSWGGLEMNTVRYAKWMQETGWNVTVFAVADSPLDQQARMEKLRVINVRRNNKYFDLSSARNIATMFVQQNIKLCWFRDTRDFSTLGLAKTIAGKKFRLIYQQAMQFGISKKDIFHTIRFGRIDAWISTLNFLAHQVKTMTRFPHDRIHVIPLGVDSSRLRPDEDLRQDSRAYLRLPAEGEFIGIIGRLDPLKGQHIAIQALRELHKKGKKLHLLICGEPTKNEGTSYELELYQLTDQSGLKDYVHFRPFDTEVFRFYHAIDYFALCSKGETFGTVTIEAMACGKAIIATNSSGTPEILDHGKCGLLFEPGNHSMLADHIHTLLSNDALKEEMRLAAKTKFSSEFSKEISVRRMDDLLMTMCRNQD